MEIYKRKIMVKVSFPSEWHITFDEILHYKSFSLLPFSTTNQTGRKCHKWHYYLYEKVLVKNGYLWAKVQITLML